MLPRISTLLTLALLAGLPTAGNAATVGVGHNHVAQSQGQSSSPNGARGRLVAPPGLCPGQSKADAPVAKQRAAMRCMVEFARHAVGLPGLAGSAALGRSARAKSGDVLHCDSFSHHACGRDFSFWMRKTGFLSSRCWRVGENLAWGTGPDATVRSRFRALIHSPRHRRNMLGAYTQIGVGMRVGSLEGHSGTHVWTQHFGTHC